MENAREANIQSPLILKKVPRTLAGEMKQAKTVLRHCFDQQHSWINGMAGKVPGEYRV